MHEIRVNQSLCILLPQFICWIRNSDLTSTSVMKKLHELLSFLLTNVAFHVVLFVLSNMMFSQMVKKRADFPQDSFWLHTNIFTCLNTVGRWGLLGKHHWERCSKQTGIAQIAIAPFPLHSNGHSGALISGPIWANAIRTSIFTA